MYGKMEKKNLYSEAGTATGGRKAFAALAPPLRSPNKQIKPHKFIMRYEY